MRTKLKSSLPTPPGKNGTPIIGAPRESDKENFEDEENQYVEDLEEDDHEVEEVHKTLTAGKNEDEEKHNDSD